MNWSVLWVLYRYATFTTMYYWLLEFVPREYVRIPYLIQSISCRWSKSNKSSKYQALTELYNEVFTVISGHVKIGIVILLCIFERIIPIAHSLHLNCYRYGVITQQPRFGLTHSECSGNMPYVCNPIPSKTYSNWNSVKPSIVFHAYCTTNHTCTDEISYNQGNTAEVKNDGCKFIF